MKNLWSRSIVVTMLMFCISCCTLQSNLNKKERPYPFYRHTVKLQAPYIVGGDIVLASGFALDAERIITAGHFCVSVVMAQMKGEIDELIDIVYVNDNDEISKMSGARIDAIDEVMDLCVVYRANHGIVPMHISKAKVRIDDPVTVVGAPLGIFPVTSEGRVVSPASEELSLPGLSSGMIINANGTFGNSGGPVYNENREVIGVVMAKSTDFLLIVVRAETIYKFLEQEYGE